MVSYEHWLGLHGILQVWWRPNPIERRLRKDWELVSIKNKCRWHFCTNVLMRTGNEWFTGQRCRHFYEKMELRTHFLLKWWSREDHIYAGEQGGNHRSNAHEKWWVYTGVVVILRGRDTSCTLVERAEYVGTDVGGRWDQKEGMKQISGYIFASIVFVCN